MFLSDHEDCEPAEMQMELAQFFSGRIFSTVIVEDFQSQKTVQYMSLRRVLELSKKRVTAEAGENVTRLELDLMTDANTLKNSYGKNLEYNVDGN